MPANEIVGLRPGELFVHRNVANLVVQNDLNCLSVLQYAIDVLRVRDVIVCGHYGCGGVRAAIGDVRFGLIDNWLAALRDTREQHSTIVDDAIDAADCLCELNVIEQARNVARTTVIHDAWRRGQAITIHGWIYSLHDGLLRDLNFTVDSSVVLDRAYRAAINAIAERSCVQR